MSPTPPSNRRPAIHVVRSGPSENTSPENDAYTWSRIVRKTLAAASATPGARRRTTGGGARRPPGRPRHRRAPTALALAFAGPETEWSRAARAPALGLGAIGAPHP